MRPFMQGHSFHVTLSLKEVKQGDSKAYMGIFKPLAQEVHEACVWVGSAGQVVGMGKGFSDVVSAAGR